MDRSDSEEISEWWQHIEHGLLQFAGRYIDDAEEAKDMVQQVALAVFVKDTPFHDKAHFQKWAYKKLKWVCLDRLRALKREKNLVNERAPHDADHQETGRILLELREEIAGLPKQQRTVADRYYLQDHTTHQIARDLHIKESTVRSLLRHARASLAERLGR